MAKHLSYRGASSIAIRQLKNLGIRYCDGCNDPSHALYWAANAIYNNRNKRGYKMFIIVNSDTSPIGKCIQYVLTRKMRVLDSLDLTFEDLTPYYFDKFTIAPEPVNIEPIWDQIRAKQERKRKLNQK